MLAIKPKTIRRMKPVLHLLLALPLLWLCYQWYQAFNYQPHGLGFNPQETSNRFSGDWALRILMLSLACTPLQRLLGKPWPIAFRRMTGLWAFAYVLVHMLSFIWLDKLWDWAELLTDIIKRPYITVGMAASLILLALAITSPKAAVRRLKISRWKQLHKLVYLANILASIHFIMMRRGFQIEPLVYLIGIGVLLSVRVLPLWKRHKKAAA